MKHVVFGAKALFVGDLEADTLIAYAAHVSQIGTADTIDLQGFNAGGNRTTVTFLLNNGTDLSVETTGVNVEALDNTYMHDQMQKFEISPDWLPGFHIEPAPPSS